MIPLALFPILASLLTGCVVTKTMYDAEVSRARSLEYELDTKDEVAADLQRQIVELQRAQARLDLELQSLELERVQLTGDLEDQRLANERMRTGLESEREKLRARESEIQEMSSTYRSLVEVLEAELERGDIQIQALRGGLQVSASEQILFDSGQAEIKQDGRPVLEAVAGQIRDLSGYSVRVEGHTDDRPISTATFPSNWELSAARAVQVVRFLESSGVAAATLSAVGYGPHQPVAINDTVENRARNRRIEIVLIPDEQG